MHHRIYPLVILLILPFLPGCGKDSSTGPKTYIDSFSLGMGRKGESLVEETTVFTGNLITIYWRVESSEAFKGADVQIDVEQFSEYGWEKVYSGVYLYVRFEDHVAVSSYYHVYGYGRFRATGSIGKERRVVGSVEFTVQEEAQE
jgi:hypothetical protein